jgi:FSR family fosmidomycin resistance protein-like MFS transporter
VGGFSLLFVASGAYVNLAQATLIDRDPERSEQTMARWTLLGSVGVTIAPLIVTGLVFFGYGWRGLYLALAGAAVVYSILLFCQRFDLHAGAERPASSKEMAQNLVAALKTPEVVRWLLLSEFANLMLDKFVEVTGIYFSDVVGVGPAAASGAVGVVTFAGLIGGILLVPALEKVRGLSVLRVSAVIVLASYIAFLLAPEPWLKFILIAVIGFCTAGWYAIIAGKIYAALPGQSGIVVTVTSLGSAAGLVVPFIVGCVADGFGLQWAMWLLALGPIALIVGLPRSESMPNQTNEIE